MPKMVVLSQTGKELNEITLADTVFGIEPNQQCIFDAVIMQRASIVRVLTIPKTVQKYAVVDVSLGVRREPDVLVRDPFVLHSGEAEELYSVRLRETMATS